MAKYKAYPEYKDSWVEWLGAVPTEWLITELKRYCWVKGGYAFPSESFTSFGEPVIRIGDISQDGSINLANCKYVSHAVANQSQSYIVQNGELLMAMTGATIGKAGFYEYEFPSLINQRVGVFKVLDKLLHYRFLWYILKSNGYQEYIKLAAFGGAQPNISDAGMVGYKTTFPSLNEQSCIAAFLDHETAKIDNLIEKQQQLIELLKEKRQAVISHAVTKGLNPDVPMKDSGVEWLGEVPAHWSIIKFSHCVNIRSGLIDPRKSPYCDYWLIAPNHIVSGEGRIINLETAREQGADSSKYLCQKGEVIYSKIRPALVKACLSPKDNVLCSADMYPMSSYNGLTNHFLLLYLLSDVFTRFAVNQADRVAMPKINRESLSDCKIPVPSIEEQNKIYSHAIKSLDNLDILLQKSQLTVELLQERRTALISAAVTGKIDVRDWVAPDTQVIEEPQEAFA